MNLGGKYDFGDSCYAEIIILVDSLIKIYDAVIDGF